MSMSESAIQTDLGFLLNDVSRLFKASFEKAIGQSGVELTMGEIRTLSYIIAHRDTRQAGLAKLMGIESMTISKYLDGLQGRGLIVRVADPMDRRANIIQATSEADSLFETIRPIAEDIYRQATHGLPQGQAQLAELSLMAVKENLRSVAGVA